MIFWREMSSASYRANASRRESATIAVMAKANAERNAAATYGASGSTPAPNFRSA